MFIGMRPGPTKNTITRPRPTMTATNAIRALPAWRTYRFSLADRLSIRT